MSTRIDEWHKLAQYDTNLQGELHANLLKNNGIAVSLQALSAIPGMNSGAVLWVQDDDVARARAILASIHTDDTTDFDETGDDGDNVGNGHDMDSDARDDTQGKG